MVHIGGFFIGLKKSHRISNLAQRKNLRGKSDKFIYLLRNKISNNYGN